MLNISQIDIESGYDYIQILDKDGNLVYDKSGYALKDLGKEGWITNPKKGETIYNFSTGWVNGDTLTVLMYTDSLTEKSGFEISEFEVQY